MRWIRFAVLVLLASVLQAGLMSVLSIARPEIRPDLLLILLVFFGSRCSSTDSVITSFAIGFVADLVSPVRGVMGPQIISYGLFGTALHNLQRMFSLRRPLFQGIAIFLVGSLTGMLGYLLASLRVEGGQTNLFVPFLWQPLYSGVIGPLFSLPVGWWMHMNRRSRRAYGRSHGPGK